MSNKRYTKNVILMRQAYVHNPDQIWDSIDLERYSLEEVNFITKGLIYETKTHNHYRDMRAKYRYRKLRVRTAARKYFMERFKLRPGTVQGTINDR